MSTFSRSEQYYQTSTVSVKGLHIHKTDYTFCSDSAVEYYNQLKIVILSQRKQKCVVAVIAPVSWWNGVDKTRCFHA